jgi:hypothetical protein
VRSCHILGERLRRVSSNPSPESCPRRLQDGKQRKRRESRVTIGRSEGRTTEIVSFKLMVSFKFH